MEGRAGIGRLRLPKAWLAERRSAAKGRKDSSLSRVARPFQVSASGLDQAELEMIDPKKTALYIPNGLSRFKANLFDRVGSKLGRIIRGKPADLEALPDDVLPIVGCSPELTGLIAKWRETGRQWCYWDRGYARRVFATWLPRGEAGGYYRYHLNSFQLKTVRDVPGDRWKALKTDVLTWRRDGKHIVVAMPTATYSRFHGLENWTEKTIVELKKYTDRKIITRDKEDKRPLQEDLRGAHALVAHGSIAAVESVICGCPVYVCADCAAALVGQTEISKIETPVYPDRQAWLNSLAYSQFNESELVDGTLWKLIT